MLMESTSRLMKAQPLACLLFASALVLFGVVAWFSMSMRFVLLVPAAACTALGMALLRNPRAGRRRTILVAASVLVLAVVWLPGLRACLTIDPRH